MATPYEIDQAYKQGLRELSPEPEDAARDAKEFGIPYGEPVRDNHFTTGQHVASLIRSHDPSAELAATTEPDATTDIDLARQEAHEYYTNEFHLTGPIHSTPETKAISAAGKAAAKAEVRPLHDRPKDLGN